MSQKIAKHRANDASNNVHRPPIRWHRGFEKVIQHLEESSKLLEYQMVWREGQINNQRLAAAYNALRSLFIASVIQIPSVTAMWRVRRQRVAALFPGECARSSPPASPRQLQVGLGRGRFNWELSKLDQAANSASVVRAGWSAHIGVIGCILRASVMEVVVQPCEFVALLVWPLERGADR